MNRHSAEFNIVAKANVCFDVAMQRYLNSVFSFRMLLMVLMGFSSGLPLALTGQTLKWWLTGQGLDMTTIGFMTLISIPYTWKFLAGPFLDRFVPPFLGRRRGWLIIFQIGLIGAIWAISEGNPSTNLQYIAVAAFLIALLSALQDIVTDAYRREYLPEEEVGLGNSIFVTGYRFGMMYSTALAFALSDSMPMGTVYKVMAAGMLLGVLATFLAPEPKDSAAVPRDLYTAFTGPFSEFLSRPSALWILAFIFFYKFGDQMATEMATPMYKLLGFTGKEVAAIVKLYGIWAAIGGGLLGGALILRMGMMRALWIFGFFQAVSTLGFAWLASHLASHEKSEIALIGVITFENLTSGMGTAAYTAFMATMTNRRYTATQYALFTSLMAIPSKIFGAGTGWFVDQFGWQAFFVGCTIAAAPGIILIYKIRNISLQQINSEPSEQNPVSHLRVDSDGDPALSGAQGIKAER